MIAALRELRVLVLGETWILPLGLIAALAALVVAREFVVPDGVWRDTAGFAVLTLAVLVLSAALRPRGRG